MVGGLTRTAKSDGTELKVRSNDQPFTFALISLPFTISDTFSDPQIFLLDFNPFATK
jgi:hypothetical protein